MHLGPPIRLPTEPKHGDLFYRLYFLDGADHISTSEEFHARDDEAAIEIAEKHRKGRPMELWQQARIVKAWR